MEMLHQQVKLTSGIVGHIRGIWQEVPDGDIQYLVKYWNKDGEQRNKWFPRCDFEIMK